MSKALDDEDVNVLGGLDPVAIDVDIEKSLKTTFDLAKRYQKEIDFHLHGRGSLGIYEIKNDSILHVGVIFLYIIQP